MHFGITIRLGGPLRKIWKYIQRINLSERLLCECVKKKLIIIFCLTKNLTRHWKSSISTLVETGFFCRTRVTCTIYIYMKRRIRACLSKLDILSYESFYINAASRTVTAYKLSNGQRSSQAALIAKTKCLARFFANEHAFAFIVLVRCGCAIITIYLRKKKSRAAQYKKTLQK